MLTGAEFRALFAAMSNHVYVLATSLGGLLITLASFVYREKGVPAWIGVIVGLLLFVWSPVLAWRDEYRARLRDTGLAVELATMRDDYYSRMNDWWTICEFEDKWKEAFDAAEATRKRIYDRLAARSAVLADEFNTQRADERLPEAIMLKSSGCLRPGVISVYWHRLDRLGNIIQRLRRQPET